MEIRFEELPVGRQLRLRREAARLTQWQVAAELGTQVMRISEAEREDGSRALPYVVRLRRQLDATLPRLVISSTTDHPDTTTASSAA